MFQPKLLTVAIIFSLGCHALCSQFLTSLDCEQLQDMEYIQIIFSAVLSNTKPNI